MVSGGLRVRPARPTTMKLKSNHLKRYKEIATLFWKYGRSDLAQEMGVDGDDIEHSRKNGDHDDPNFKRETKVNAKDAGAPDQLVDDLEAMGPIYVKLGQVLAGRPDLVPEAYRTALARLQDN